MDAFEITLLFDTYGEMLTEKQREYMDMRYNQDMSLGEIAAVQGVSRQAVFDNLSRAEAQLQKMEENIGCVRRDRAVEDALAHIQSALEELYQSRSERVLRAADDIQIALELLKE